MLSTKSKLHKLIDVRCTCFRILDSFLGDKRKMSYISSFECMHHLRNCRDIQQLKGIHALIITSGYQKNPCITAKLVSLYVDNGGSMDDGWLIFKYAEQRDILLWNVMIKGYATVGPCEKSIKVFEQMQRYVRPNVYTFPFVLKACAAKGDVNKAKSIHANTLKVGVNDNVFVCNSFIAAHIGCNEIETARKMFDEMVVRDVISWNTIMVGYTKIDCGKEALILFHRMLKEFEGEPDRATLVSILPACGELAAFQEGQWIHAYAIKNQVEVDMILGSALVRMYSKCGFLRVARRVFDVVQQRNVVLWNSIIGSYGLHGRADDALDLFYQMLEDKVCPDGVTFVYVLSACRHAGYAEEGWRYFHSMHHKFGILPSEEHYACMVDILGRSGKLEGALKLIRNMTFEPGSEVWGALLGACRIYNLVGLAEVAAKHLFLLDNNDAGHYVLLANIYAAGDRWEEVSRVRRVMRESKVRKALGCSSIKVEHRVHAFGSGNESHPSSDSIYTMLGCLEENMRASSHVPAYDTIWQDIGGKEYRNERGRATGGYDRDDYRNEFIRSPRDSPYPRGDDYYPRGHHHFPHQSPYAGRSRRERSRSLLYSPYGSPDQDYGRRYGR